VTCVRPRVPWCRANTDGGQTGLVTVKLGPVNGSNPDIILGPRSDLAVYCRFGWSLASLDLNLDGVRGALSSVCWLVWCVGCCAKVQSVLLCCWCLLLVFVVGVWAWREAVTGGGGGLRSGV
jgi:hypothetical protein